MTECTICGERIYGPEEFETIVCEPCWELNLAGNPMDYIPTSERVPDQQPWAYIPYNPRDWNPTQGGLPPIS